MSLVARSSPITAKVEQVKFMTVHHKARWYIKEKHAKPCLIDPVVQSIDRSASVWAQRA